CRSITEGASKYLCTALRELLRDSLSGIGYSAGARYHENPQLTGSRYFMQSSAHTPSSYWWPIIAAATALIVVHGFGRFVYTPLLPLLVEDGLISLPQAASLATWNYIGYLSGAMLALFLYQR